MWTESSGSENGLVTGSNEQGNRISVPVSVAVRFKARVWGRLLAGVACSNPARGLDVYVVCVCVLYSKDKRQKPGQPGQRSSTNKVQSTKRNPAGGTDVCVCVCACVRVVL
jgi:hypothetical protein